MMKLLASICVLVVLAVINEAQAENLKCTFPAKTKSFDKWPDMEDACVNRMRKQIQMEIDASTNYLAMAAYFSQDTVNRPGFAEHFFKAAKEEREHGSKLIEYLSMRGNLNDNVSKLITVPTVSFSNWTGLTALKKAFDLETAVTESIRGVIKTCEGGKNDFHLVDYLTGVFLEEQLTGQRDLAGKITTLEKMLNTHGELAEFLFDKKM